MLPLYTGLVVKFEASLLLLCCYIHCCSLKPNGNSFAFFSFFLVLLHMQLYTRHYTLLLDILIMRCICLIIEPLDADDLKPHDVGVDSSMPYFKHADSKGPPRVTYLHFYDCPKFSVI